MSFPLSLSSPPLSLPSLPPSSEAFNQTCLESCPPAQPLTLSFLTQPLPPPSSPTLPGPALSPPLPLLPALALMALSLPLSPPLLLSSILHCLPSTPPEPRAPLHPRAGLLFPLPHTCDGPNPKGIPLNNPSLLPLLLWMLFFLLVSSPLRFLLSLLALLLPRGRRFDRLHPPLLTLVRLLKTIHLYLWPTLLLRLISL